jgi:hypothetical protein
MTAAAATQQRIVNSLRVRAEDPSSIRRACARLKAGSAKSAIPMKRVREAGAKKHRQRSKPKRRVEVGPTGKMSSRVYSRPADFRQRQIAINLDSAIIL